MTRSLWLYAAFLIGVALLITAAARGANARPAGITPFWWADGTCETGHIGAPGDGAPRFDWGKHHRPLEGSKYEGFTGFAVTTWRAWAGDLGLLKRYPHAYDAPPLVQQRVASWAFHRWGGWGCLLGSTGAAIRSLPGA